MDGNWIIVCTGS